ncbi:MAG: class I SAM-dependent methyltransferase [Verrucomicrobia bacterium]|nr:class I SAM-dependent methyltransferase [Verrucomicrobiota bacterium]
MTDHQSASDLGPRGYYDRLAPIYDASRFANSYGRYLDLQERRWLTRWLRPYRDGAILDLACGTGRLLDSATHGLDLSAAMLREAGRNHPDKPLLCAPATDLGRLGVTFDAVFCLHLCMHLPVGEIGDIIRACEPWIRPGGVLVLDAPSAWRRRLLRFRPTGWHGATALTARQLRDLAGAGWRLQATGGLLFFPVHRLPVRLRPWLRAIDTLLGISPLKALSSYTLFCLERR